MTFIDESDLRAYADVTVKVGLNLRAGQHLLIRAPIESAPLVRAVARSAYENGACLVEALWSDPELLVARFAHAPAGSFAEHTSWWVDAGLEYVKNGGALLSIAGADPDLLKDADPGDIQVWRAAESVAYAPFARQISGDAINWTIVAYPAQAWAEKVYPDLTAEDAQARLWSAIRSIVRLDQPDPVATWEAHVRRLEARTAFLNERAYDALHFRGSGTDLRIGLPYRHSWEGGATKAKIGIVNVPNMPTEEVFTAPHRGRADGTVTATMPLSNSGRLIEDFSLTFKDGRVVDLKAGKNEAVLRSIVEMDEGSARLGEVALVPNSSPIAQTGTLFYNTLFDENAASHIALGRAYRTCIEDCGDIEDEDFNAVGGNTSHMHVDFMIGSAEVDVDGIDGDGNAEPLMRAGEWVNEV